MKQLRSFAFFLIYALTFALTALLSHWPEFETLPEADTQKFQASSPVEFLSATECRGEHGVYRWAAKTDEEKPPKDEALIPSVTPRIMGSWDDLEGVHKDSPRQGREHGFCRLTGKVVAVKAEEDGDLHLEIAGTYGTGVRVVCEIPVGKPWDSLREEVFSWTKVKFPCRPHKLALKKFPVIMVIGKPLWDGQHSSSAPNRRANEPETATWEVHPIMALEIVSDQ